MSTIPKRLTTRCLFDHDGAKAAAEAVTNILWLVLAGHFDTASRMTTALLSPGPWRLSPKSPLQHSAWQLQYWLCDALQRPLPALDTSSEAAQGAREQFEARRQSSPAPAWAALFESAPRQRTWSATQLADILASVRPDNFGGAFNDFQHDAVLVLKQRVRDGVASTDHAAMADTIEQGARIAFPRDTALFAMAAAWQAAALDIAQDRRDAAITRLARLLPSIKLGNEHNRHFAEIGTLFDPVFTGLLASRALAPALGISESGAAAYLDAFLGRSPYTLKADVPRPWKTVLRAYATRLKEEGTDSDALVQCLQYGEPACKALLQRAKRGQVLNTACPEDELAQLEARLGTTLPPSYREFLLASNGVVVPDFVSLLPAAQVDWFARLDASNAIDAWNNGADEASDEEYAVYGADQDCIHMRPRHLRTALQISTAADGDVLLLIPAVRFGEEWEAWFLGNKNPGAYRFRSFRDLMEQRVLAGED